MAKLNNLRPVDSKRSHKFTITGLIGATGSTVNMKKLMNAIDGLIPGLTPGNLGKYFFRIKKIELFTSVDNSMPVIILGRIYELNGRSNKVGSDASYAPSADEFWGLWHDSVTLEALADKGATSGLDEIQLIDVVKAPTTDGSLISGWVHIDFIPKKA